MARPREEKSRHMHRPSQAQEGSTGHQTGGSRDHSLSNYLDTNAVQKHGGAHNLKISWILCANLYFPFQRDLPKLAAFLAEHVATEIQTVDAVELEFAAFPPLDPQTLLGEPDTGGRGANQTSPDVAFS